MERPIYANTITVSASENKDEFVLIFSQKYPNYGSGDGKIAQAEDVVASVVVGRAMVEQLPKIFKDILGDGEK